MHWIATNYGTKLKPELPVVIDSVRRIEADVTEQFNGGWYIAKPAGAYGSVSRRLYHAWLVLTNRAMAMQFMRDHVALATK